jgi:hypothetical protein
MPGQPDPAHKRSQQDPHLGERKRHPRRRPPPRGPRPTRGDRPRPARRPCRGRAQVERPCGPWGRGLLAGIDVPILLMIVDPENSARSGGIGSRRCDRGRPRRIRGRPGAWSPKDPPRPVRRSRAARSSPPGPHRGNHRHRRPTGTEPGRGSQGRRRHPGSRRPARSRPGSSILQVAWRRADQAIRLHTLRRADLDGEPIKNSKIKFNVHSWDLKSPAFRRPLPVRRDRAGADGWPGTWGGISEGLGRTERVTEEPLQSESYLWSGFQPTAEPTVFRRSVVQSMVRQRARNP